MKGITPRLVKRLHAGKRSELRLPIARAALLTSHAYPLSRGERFLVLGHTDQLLHEVTDDEAVRSGHANAQEFWDWWLETFNQGWGHRTHTRESPAVVHAIDVYTVELDRSHRIRLLHKDSSHGYTENPYMAVSDEPESVEPEYLERFAKGAEDTGKILRAEQKAKEDARTQARRLRQARLTATRKGVDIDENVDWIERQLSEIERKLDQAA